MRTVALASLLLVLPFSSLGACSSNNPNTGDSGTNPDGGGTDSPTTGDSGPTAGFRAITLPGNDERVTGFYCSGAKACVISTEPFGDAGHIYSSDGSTITGTLITGDSTFANQFGTLGTVSFLGFSFTASTLVAHVSGAEAAYVRATGDVTKAASWTASYITNDPSPMGLNSQFGFGSGSSHFTLMAKGRIWDTTDTPGPSATWTNIYSPQAVPSIPADILTQRANDPTLCDTDPSVSVSPDLVQPIYIASDRSLIVTPSGTVNQNGDDTPGVCISTDGGLSFHHAEFANVPAGEGPVGIACSSGSHCVAYGGLQSQADSAYVYVSNNASQGATSTWTKATTPALPTDTELHAAAFAPDGMHGWIVGATAAQGPLLFTTSDGGSTWTDATSTISALAQGNRLHSVYAFDGTHVWIGGEHDTLLTTGN